MPTHGLAQCIIIDLWGNIHTSVYWNKEHSQHAHSVWQKAKWYCEYDDLLKTLPVAEQSQFKPKLECKLCDHYIDAIYGYVFWKESGKTYPMCKTHYLMHTKSPLFLCTEGSEPPKGAIIEK